MAVIYLNVAKNYLLNAYVLESVGLIVFDADVQNSGRTIPGRTLVMV